MSGTVVFLGPTLPAAEAQAILPGARIEAPARQGDVLRAVRDAGATAIGLVDGAFLDGPAVWHREILWALEQGVRVVGAASMGALRAAELHGFGMEGVGVVFDAYRTGTLPGWDNPFEDDDEVAVVHAPAELGYQPLSDAMVDIRVTLAQAEAAGVLDRAGRDTLAAKLKALHFPQRRLHALAGPALAPWLAQARRSQKAADAALLLQALCEPPACSAPRIRMEQALTWTRFLAASRAVSETEQAAIRALEADPARWQRTAREALGRTEILRAHPAPASANGRAALSAFRTAHGLVSHAALTAWAAANGLDAAGLLRLAGEEATIEAAIDHASGPALDAALADVLRLTGRFGTPPR